MQAHGVLKIVLLIAIAVNALAATTAIGLRFGLPALAAETIAEGLKSDGYAIPVEVIRKHAFLVVLGEALSCRFL